MIELERGAGLGPLVGLVLRQPEVCDNRFFTLNRLPALCGIGEEICDAVFEIHFLSSTNIMMAIETNCFPQSLMERRPQASRAR